ncbi:MAG: c-type cytochrome, partial [Bdellovibrionales bacterium]|nr:c-type cytochrome [Bdellovibrionales bacterium]
FSMDGGISCNSCHNVMAGGDDNMPTSIGHKGQRGGRNAPTVWNAAFQKVQFWDGRAATLEEQAKGPLTNPVEMAMTDHDLVIKRIKLIPEYTELFEKVFGKKGDAVTIDNAAKAIAAFERTLVNTDSAYDRYLAGDKKALSPDAQKGLALVNSVGCVSCHQGSHFNGPDAIPMGTGFYQKFPTFPGSDFEKKYELAKDAGRMEATKKSEDRNFWRVATWRNVALTSPYFHNGSVKNLDEAVRVMAKTQLNKSLSEEEVKAIVAFLNSLTGTFPKMTMPRLPPTPGTNVL